MAWNQSSHLGPAVGAPLFVWLPREQLLTAHSGRNSIVLTFLVRGEGAVMLMDEASPASAHDLNPRDTRVGWLLVALQFLLIGALLRELRVGEVTSRRGVAGVAGAIAGAAAMGLASRRLGRELRTHPAPSSTAVLRVDGAYGVVRHPIYAGLLLFAAGLAVVGGTVRAAAAFGALVALLSRKARFEERLLEQRFPEYREYARRTPRFIPAALPIPRSRLNRNA